MLNFFLSLIYAYIACFGFGFIFHLRGKLLFITPIGGVLLWAVYLILEAPIESVVARSLIATMAAAIFCESIARIMKIPVTLFMIIAILPLVPGSGIYYTMLACTKSDWAEFFSKGLETIGVAGAIAVGMLMISSIFRMATDIHRHFKSKKLAE